MTEIMKEKDIFYCWFEFYLVHNKISKNNELVKLFTWNWPLLKNNYNYNARNCETLMKAVIPICKFKILETL